MIKRTISILLLTALLLVCTVAVLSCKKDESNDKIKVVCTMFPQYDWLRNIVGESDRIELTLLIKNGTDTHSYQPTAADIMAISECDLIVYLGRDADTWVSKALEMAECEKIKKVALCESENITLRDISSSSHEHEHPGDYGDQHTHSHEGHDHASFDEHVWLSLKNAEKLTEELCDVISELDPSDAKKYHQNAEKYISEIRNLDEKYRSVTELSTPEDRFLIFCDRFPFVYMLEDYGIDYSAAFEGCSTDANADFATVVRLVEEADAHGVKSLIVTESSDRALANTVKASSKSGISRVLVMNSLQSINDKQIKSGVTYLSMMNENLDVLASALNLKK